MRFCIVCWDPWGCVSNLSASTPAPGTVAHQRGPTLTFGEPTGGAGTERCQEVLKAARLAGCDVHDSARIQQVIWFKLWGDMTLNPISGMTGATSDKVVGDPLLRNFMALCMNESKEMGARIGIEVNATPEARFAATEKLGEFRTSMLQDVDAGRPMGGEFVVKRPSGFEVIRGNAVAMRKN